ncbi:hypothetical protein LCGC14_1315590 [marine sediment metagenome]|uniref:Uncharacterized protein n=1 Tax=marine sediment metagenome TaxID=412755 RepID=A0A0F9NNH6_9ZZZZ
MKTVTLPAETSKNRSYRTALGVAVHKPTGRVWTLRHHTAGLECAGSMARWTNEVWSVTTSIEGISHGQRFASEAAARARLAALAGEGVPA